MVRAEGRTVDRNETVDESAYAPSVARLSSGPAALPAGLGMLVSPTQVVTCAHVVNAALGRNLVEQAAPDAGQLVAVSFPQADAGAVRYGRVVAWVRPPLDGAGGGDIAGLLLLEKAPDGAVPGRFAQERPRPGTWGRVFGYPGSEPDWGRGKWVDIDVKGVVEGGLLQVESRSSQTVKAQPGYSGSPVWDPGTGAAVGLLQLAPFAEKPERDAYLLDPGAIAESWVEPFGYLLIPDNPYRGLQPFTQDDERVFFGRAGDIDALTTIVRAQGAGCGRTVRSWQILAGKSRPRRWVASQRPDGRTGPAGTGSMAAAG